MVLRQRDSMVVAPMVSMAVVESAAAEEAWAPTEGQVPEAVAAARGGGHAGARAAAH